MFFNIAYILDIKINTEINSYQNDTRIICKTYNAFYKNDEIEETERFTYLGSVLYMLLNTISKRNSKYSK